MSLFLNIFFIFLARVCDVTMSTVRILMIMRGKAALAAFIGFFEVSVYVLALSRVIGDLDRPILLITYASGFAAGNYIGSLVEERLALGYATAQIISLEAADPIAADLREQGFGVTILEGYGRKGVHKILLVLLKRRDIPCLLEAVRACDVNAFISVMDTRKILGGHFTKIKAK